MTVSRISGRMLKDNLERDANLSIATDVVYVDITNGRLGVKNTSPTATLSVTGTTTVTGNITGGNVTTTGTANIGTLAVTGAGTVGTTLGVTGNITGGNVTTAGIANIGTLAVTGAGTVSSTLGVTGNITGGNVTTTGTANIGTLAVTGAGTVGTSLGVTGNITGGNLTTAGTANIGTLAVTTLANIKATTASTSTTSGALQVAGGTGIAGNAHIGGLATITGNITAGNVTTAGTANIGTLAVTGAGTVGTTLGVTGNITGGNVITAGTASVANILVSSTNTNAVLYTNSSKILTTTNNLTFDGTNLVLTGSANIDNVRIDGAIVSSNTSLTIASASNGNITLTPNGTGLIDLDTTTGLVIPVGTTLQRPATAVEGTIRYNSSMLIVEAFDGTDWIPVGTDFVSITSQQIVGDNANTVFTLSDDATSASIIVSTNGVVQLPDTAYTVTGNAITFAEAPLSSDVIDIRFISAVTIVRSITSSTGNSEVGFDLSSVYIRSNSIDVITVTPTTVTSVGNIVVTSGASATSTTTGAIVVTGGIGVSGNAHVGGLVAVTGNITGGNINTAGRVVASTLTSNVATGTAPLTISSTTLVTNLNADLLDGYNTASTNTASTVVVRDASGNFSAGTITATLSGAATTAGTVTTASQPNITSIGTLSSVSVTGNITGGNVTTTGIANIGTLAVTGAGTVGTSLGVTGNITGGNLSVSTGAVTCGNIVNSNANGVGNIGTSSVYFNTIFAKATSAQYADLAELCVSDRPYYPGTVLVFGGEQEVTLSTNYADSRLAGIVSTDPAYLMNAGASNAVPIVLAGRAPCCVVGPVNKGDILTTSLTPGHAEAIKNNSYVIGSIVGKSLENCGPGLHTIVVMVNNS